MKTGNISLLNEVEFSRDRGEGGRRAGEERAAGLRKVLTHTSTLDLGSCQTYWKWEKTITSNSVSRENNGQNVKKKTTFLRTSFRELDCVERGSKYKERGEEDSGRCQRYDLMKRSCWHH